MAGVRRTILIALGVVGGLVLVVVVAGLLYLTFGDLSRFEPRIEAAVADALGREFRIDGDLEIEALPHPSVLATDVVLGNAEWASPEPMLTVGRVAVSLDLWSLISGPVIVEQFELADTALLVEQDEQGRSNLAFGSPGAAAEDEPEPEAGEAGAPVVLEHASITSFRLVSRQPGAEDLTVTIDSLEAETADDQSLAAMLAGSVQDIAIGVDARIAPATALQTGGPADYRLEASIDDAVVSIEGDVDALFAAAPSAGDGSVRQHVRFSGDVDSLRLMGAVFDVADLPELGLTVAGDLELGGDGIAVDPLSVELGDSDFSGSVRAEFGEKLAIVIDGQSSRVDLTPFLPPEETDTGDGAEPGSDSTAADDEVGDPAVAEADAASDGELVFPDQPLPVEQLQALDLTANLAIGEFVMRDLNVEDLELALVNTDGQSRLETRFSGMEGGTAEAVIELDAGAEVASLDVDLSISEARLNLASGDLEDPGQIPPIDVAIDVRSSGATPHALAAAANGRLSVTFGAGLIENSAVGFVSGDIIAQLFSALNPFAAEEEYSTLECVVVGMTITDGEALLDPILMQTEKLQIIGGGQIELDPETLDVEFNTKPRSGVGITADMFVTPFVKLSGTLAEPGVGLNARGALLQGGAAALTGGLTLLLGGLADRATAEAGQCETALAAIDEAAAGG